MQQAFEEISNEHVISSGAVNTNERSQAERLLLVKSPDLKCGSQADDHTDLLLILLDSKCLPKTAAATVQVKCQSCHSNKIK